MKILLKLEALALLGLSIFLFRGSIIRGGYIRYFSLCLI